MAAPRPDQHNPIEERVLAAQTDHLAADELIEDYLPFIKSETAKFTGRIPMEGQDDELSIAMIAFHEAMQSYRAGRGSFLKFAAVNIRRRLIDHSRREKRHRGHASLDARIGEDGEGTLRDTIADGEDAYEALHIREATRKEIQELTEQLASFGLTLGDIADNCPRQDKTLQSCKRVLACARENPEHIRELLRTKKLPIAALSLHSGVHKKTLERHRKYLMALLIIYSNGYELIRGHLKRIFVLGEGGKAQ